MSGSYLDKDRQRYAGGGGVPRFLRLFRKYQQANGRMQKLFYRVLYHFSVKKNHIEIPLTTQIGAGLYLGHAYCITVNPRTTIGANCNIHKGVTIGQENRGDRAGVPTIGNCVWMGVNSTIVGRVIIGDDVLIAPNTYVNCDVPSHSVVFGNPCIIKHKDNATEDYINRKCDYDKQECAIT